MKSTALTTCRVALAAWVGAAVLFVVTGIREVTSTEPAVDVAAVKDTLVGIRFPAYYLFGFLLVSISLLGALAAGDTIPPARRRWIVGLLVLALAMMVVDYLYVYEPLLEMITPPGKNRASNFKIYHDASKYVNAADVGLCLIAAVLVCRPVESGGR